MVSFVRSKNGVLTFSFNSLLFLVRKIDDFWTALASVLAALGGREGCQNDPRKMLNNPPGGMSSKNVSVLKKSRLHDGFCAEYFPLVFGHRNKLLSKCFCQKVVFVFVTTSGNTNVDNMRIST